MSKHKQNAVEVNPSETEITKVVAKVAEQNLLPEISEQSNEMPPEYAAAIEAVQTALFDYCRSTWRLAWALVDFRAIHERVHPSNRLTDKQMAELLGIKLSPARIGQLVNTALAYPRQQVDESIDFRVYELARVKSPGATPDKRLKLVKNHPTTEAMAKVTSCSRSKAKVRRELIILVTPGVDEYSEPSVKVRLNGQPLELPSNLLTAISNYANELFVDDEND